MFEKLGSKFATLVRRDPADRLAAALRTLDQGWSETAFETLRNFGAQGNPAAQYRLGRMYENAEGVLQSIPDAVHWYRLAAAQGDLKSQERLGLIYFIEPPAPASLTAALPESGAAAPAIDDTLAQFFPHGITVRQDYAEAATWNRLAAERGSAEAQARLGHQLALGLGCPRDPAEAERWFAAAAAQSHVEGQLGLGLVYAGNYDTPPDLERAAHWLKVAADAGNRIAQYGIGKLLLHGEGVARDAAAAVLRLESAAAQEYAPAMYLLGMIYWRGEGVPADTVLAESWLRRAVVRGHGEASCALAQMLLERPEDDGIEAAAMLRERAEAGNPRAAAALAELYVFGRGVPRDAAEAARWREVSGTVPRPETLTMLASLHVEGIGAEQDYAAAAKLLKEAADRGSADALFNLGSLHLYGKGMPADVRAAAELYRRAAQSGSAAAAIQLGSLLAREFHLAHGEDGLPDYSGARPWIEQAALAGDADAQAWMGDCCRLGLLGPEDFAAAESWYRRAAAGGHVGCIVLLASAIDAMDQPTQATRAEAFGLWLAAASAGDALAKAHVARCYRDGIGVARDASAAARWLRADAQARDGDAPGAAAPGAEALGIEALGDEALGDEKLPDATSAAAPTAKPVRRRKKTISSSSAL